MLSTLEILLWAGSPAISPAWAQVLQDNAEHLSLTLTVPTLYFSARVLQIYGPETWTTSKAVLRREVVPQNQILICGIVYGFLGMFVDNLYWGLAWGAEFLDLPIARTLFNLGVYSNIPFRQILGILAGSLHILAATNNWSVVKQELKYISGLTLWSGLVLWIIHYFL